METLFVRKSLKVWTRFRLRSSVPKAQILRSTNTISTRASILNVWRGGKMRLAEKNFSFLQPFFIKSIWALWRTPIFLKYSSAIAVFYSIFYLIWSPRFSEAPVKGLAGLVFSKRRGRARSKAGPEDSLFIIFFYFYFISFCTFSCSLWRASGLFPCLNLKLSLCKMSLFKYSIRPCELERFWYYLYILYLSDWNVNTRKPCLAFATTFSNFSITSISFSTTSICLFQLRSLHLEWDTMVGRVWIGF